MGFLAINGNYFIVLFIIAGLILAMLRRIELKSPIWYLAGLCSAYLVYVLSLGFHISMDDAYRFYVPLIPLMSLLLFEIAFTFHADIERIQPVWMAGCLLTIVFLVPLRFNDLGHAWAIDLNWGVLPYRIAARDVASGLDQGHIALGRWLREHASPDATIVLYDAGAIPYFSGLRTIDTWSLTDPQLLELNRALAFARSEAEREVIRGKMRSYILSQNPEYIVQDNLSLLDDPVVRTRYRPVGRKFIYLNWYMCGQQQGCSYILEPWQRQ